MPSDETLTRTDWLGACRRASERLCRLLGERVGAEDRAEYTGTTGAGGDWTLVLDSDAEQIVFDELAGLQAGGAAFTAFSEERGERDFGGGPVRVVIDPIDGSTNAKRDALHYALSVAVADGPSMADVRFAFVHDFGSGEQWWATRGEGAWLARDAGSARAADPGRVSRLERSRSTRRSRDGRLELVAVEASDPRLLAGALDELIEVAYRVRCLGTIAVSLCQVAAGRYDGMLTLRRCRGVDAAAGQLIVREAGGEVSFAECPGPLEAPLDATASSFLYAARSAEGLRELVGTARGRTA